MSLQAHTNQPGSHFKSEFRTNTRQGFYLSIPLNDESVSSVMVNWSYKAPLTHGNHLNSTPYRREVRSLTKDNPSVKRFIWMDGEIKRADYVERQYLSKEIPTMFMSPPGQFMADLDTTRNEAMTKARAALRDESSVDNGADLAEARQTVNLMAQSSTAILDALKHAYKKDWPGVAASLGVSPTEVSRAATVHSGWLQYQYGWKPLMGSIHDNYNLLRGVDSNRLYLEVNKGGKTNLTVPVNGGGLVGQWKCEGGSRCGLKARIDNEFFRSGDTYGLVNPLVVGWEVVPFSFVVDWFIPVGTMLQSLSATSGLTFLDGYVSTRSQCVFSASRDGDYLDKGLVEVQNFALNRDILTSFPLPGVYGKKNPFTTTHTMNALALIGANIR